MSEVPVWLNTMRSLKGLSEKPGAADEERILAMRTRVAQVYPEMSGYAANYVHDSIPWCGLAVAYVMADNGYRPVFGASDTGRFLWARAWADWGTKLNEPQPGCVVVMSREGGGHVTLLEEETNGSLRCIGGNQSDAVNVSTYPKSAVIAYRWPNEAPTPIKPDAASMPLVKEPDTGPAVIELQRLLGIDADGEFGPQTDAAVRAFQAANGLLVDGEVGPITWAALYGDRVEEDDLTAAQVSEITQLAAQSAIARYPWKDRGIAPPGFTKGLSCVYAYCYKQFKAGDTSAKVMAQAVGSEDKDALALYAQEFQQLGLFDAGPGVGTLRNLFVLMFGLGMRESSGRYCTGRDQSAANTTADTCEAGLFQTSFNAASASPEMRKLFETYSNEQGETGFLEVFRERVTCSSADWQDYGSGDGAKYQELSKRCPAFHCEFTAVGLRVLRKHWGPIGRKEVEIRGEAATLLQMIEALVDKAPVPPEPPVPLTWAERTTAAIIEAIAPVILDTLENSLPPPTLTRTATTTLTLPAPAAADIPPSLSHPPLSHPPLISPVEDKPADWADVAAAVMPRLTQQQALDIFMSMLKAPEPPTMAPPATPVPPPPKKSWFGS